MKPSERERVGDFRFQLQAAANRPGVLELLIYDRIGKTWDGSGVTAKQVAEQIKNADDVRTIEVKLNSAGGEVWDAIAIYNTLVKHKARVTVDIDGMALSAASVLAMAGDEIRMAENAMMMIHDPSSLVWGTAGDMRKQADLLDKAKSTLVATYVARTKLSEAKVSGMMEAETWLTAEEAIKDGFADRVTAAKRIAASAAFDPARFRHPPDGFVERITGTGSTTETIPMKCSKSELTASIPRASASFVAACVAEGLSIAEAKDKYIAGLEAAAMNARPGTESHPEGHAQRGGIGDEHEFMRMAKELANEQGMSLRQAQSRVAREQPELYADYREGLHGEAPSHRTPART